MNKTFTILAAALALGAASTAAHANDFLVQMDETTAGLYVNTYEDGVLIQNAFVGGESYLGGYGLGWNEGSFLTSNVDVAANFVDADGSLSDTWHIYGNAGDGSINIPFISEATTWLDAPSIRETGGWQTLTTFTLANGDNYTWQLGSPEGGVPEPAAWALMVLGVGGLGLALRGARKTASAAA